MDIKKFNKETKKRAFREKIRKLIRKQNLKNKKMDTGKALDFLHDILSDYCENNIANNKKEKEKVNNLYWFIAKTIRGIK